MTLGHEAGPCTWPTLGCLNAGSCGNMARMQRNQNPLRANVAAVLNAASEINRHVRPPGGYRAPPDPGLRRATITPAHRLRGRVCH
jgi:hypothetical protein